MSNTVHEIDMAALDALIDRLHEAKQFDLVLSAEDIQLLLSALATLSMMQTRLSANDITIHKMRKLMGIVAASESLSALLGEKGTSGAGNSGKQDKKKRKKKPSAPRVKPKVVHHSLDTLNKGDVCPACEVGTLSKYEPASLLRITGQSPYEAVNHVLERLRCNACGEYFTAPLPKDVIADGDANQKYGYSARSLIGINKYYMGAPFYRQEALQDILGMPIAASTQFDQCEKLADHLHAVYKVLINASANAVHFYLDDTTHRILDQTEIIKPQRKTKKQQRRTGTYASGLIATLEDGHHIVLFKTNIGHAGEWIDEVLEKRDQGQAPPILMSDALTRNKPSKISSIQALCNSHGRRQFVDILNQFPDEVGIVLNWYKVIWRNDDETKAQQLKPLERLAYHRAHSLPIMQQIRDWGEQQLANEQVEANSGLGKAIRYFLTHYEGLTRFCTVEGAMLDNNRMEAQLKVIVRGRKNSSFYKTLSGAAISDVITSMIATCVSVGTNPFNYFNAIQRHQNQVVASPDDWLPWNYQLNF